MPLIIALISKLKSPNREKRKELYLKIKEKEQQFIKQLNEMYDSLIELRNAKANASGFPNYRDFKWYEKNLPYTPNDTENLCDSIKEVFIPILKEFNNWRIDCLGLSKLMPWDTSVDIFSKTENEYYKDTDDLKRKVRNIYKRIHPDFCKFFDILEQHDHLDLDLRPNKSPGMFSYNLLETGVPYSISHFRI